MKLVKTTENVNRQYGENGVTETPTSVTYNIEEEDGTIIGTANVYLGGYSMNIGKSGDITALKADLEAMLVAVV